MAVTILDKDAHARLLLDMEHIREVAHIPEYFIQQSMTNFCDTPEIEWMKGYHAHRQAGKAGLIFLGQKNSETRMMGMCGAFIRNFLDARVIPLNTLMQLQKEVHPPNPTVLFIPNLFLDSFGKSLSAWQVQVIYDILLGRFTAGKTTVAYIESLEGFRNLYGNVAVDHLNQHYTIL